MKKWVLFVLIAISIVAVGIVVYLTFNPSEKGQSAISANVIKGDFVVDITTTGELEAKNSVEINGPQGLRNFRIWNVTIQDIIDEGTFVKKGAYVATLDPTELTNNIKDAQIELDKIESQYTQTRLDTALEMRQSRNEIVNLRYAVRERELVLEQSQYEPPATINQAEIDLEKARRTLAQAIESYAIKQEQNAAKMREVAASLQKQRNNLQGMMDLREQFVIYAEEDGMLIYKKDWNGNAIKAGSQISAWNPTVAILPDLSTMLSQTYINEVDIRKVKVGQKVEIGLDAFPEKKFTGEVIRVANIGEQRPNTDAKVFKVSIQINEKDELLRPAMTTSNRIIISRKEDVLYIPIEAVFNQKDSINFVFLKKLGGVQKQEVMLGIANRNEIVVQKGLEEGDEVLLQKVAGAEDEPVNLLPEMKGRRHNKLRELEEPALQPDTAVPADPEASGPEKL